MKCESAASIDSNYKDNDDFDQLLLKHVRDHPDYHRHFALVFNKEVKTVEGYKFTPRFSLYFNTTVHHSLPMFNALMTEYKLRQIMGTSSNDHSSNAPYYHLTAHSLPMSKSQEQDVQEIVSVFSSLMLLIPYCFIAANFVVFLIKECASKAKHLQFTCGVNAYSYWLANLSWDMIMFFIICVLSMIVFAAFDNENFVGTVKRFFATACLLIFYGFSTMCLAYVLSYGFTSPTGGQLAIAGIMVFFGFALVIVNYILDFIESTESTNAKLKHFYRIFPPFCFGEGLMKLSAMDLLDQVKGKKKVRTGWEWDAVGCDICWMFVEGAVLFLVVLGVDTRFFSIAYARCKAFINRLRGIEDEDGEYSPVAEQAHAEETESGVSQMSATDSDVLAERKLVQSIMKQGTIPPDIEILLTDLTKVFPKTRKTPEKVAVNHLNLTVPKGECFGFLGINGAGKTTTLSMLTHDIPVTSGDAYIARHSITKDFKSTQALIGYCPQFDPLLDRLTGREHLRMFGRLKGIPPEKLDKAADQLMELTGMMKHGDYTTDGYSGGTKRKLSLAIALIGSPEVVFLDEPSSGMDPVARRQMWDAIKHASHNKSVSLTTHSMEECEALCTRVGIMVSGQFHCLGAIQHLKNKFGKGYSLEFKVQAAVREQVKDFVAEELPSAVLQEEHSEMLKYSLPKKGLTLGMVFEKIEGAKADLGIDDYSVSQTTLEEVFINVARSQSEEEHKQE